jgi:hypothetical protein
VGLAGGLPGHPEHRGDLRPARPGRGEGVDQDRGLGVDQSAGADQMGRRVNAGV